MKSFFRLSMVSFILAMLISFEGQSASISSSKTDILKISNKVSSEFSEYVMLDTLKSYISGTILTPRGDGLKDVSVKFTVHPQLANYPKETKSNTSGQYNADHYQGYDYTIALEKNDDHNNGVSTLDMVFIQRYILGIDTFTVYQKVAADANDDGKITAADLTEIRKLLLGIKPRLTNQSWRFSLKGTPILLSPINFMEYVAVKNLAKDMSGYDFTAIKIGDVNYSAEVHLNDQHISKRSTQKLLLCTDNVTLQPGENIRIPVRAEKLNDVFGFQYTLNLNNASFVGIEKGVLDITDENIWIKTPDQMTLSYSEALPISASQNDVLFTLVVRADQLAQLKDVIHLNSDFTDAEYYDKAFNVGDVQLLVNNSNFSAVQLHQNMPNPFSDETVISFEVAEAQPISLTFYDLSGKVLGKYEMQAVPGNNIMRLTKDMLGVSGTVFYSLQAADAVISKKMIIIE
ncbi:MAG: T9SS type A sorting domain-containing protein [Saprospiraceae bacterium]|nr:MAG: Ig family protein [Bacteroidetes bacterium OLB9]MCO6463994.1 T9SS type A sorting domain-containing protein [Saprospiraceae bacterium]MCZ2337006.1 dockerin type I domain-containing protein [Chitinophagales bacterium]